MGLPASWWDDRDVALAERSRSTLPLLLKWPPWHHFGVWDGFVTLGSDKILDCPLDLDASPLGRQGCLVEVF